MKLTITLSVFLALGSTNCIHAEKSKPTAEISDPVKRKLFIDPSSTSVRLGKATLIVSPLTRRGGNYIGDYQLKVRPSRAKMEQLMWCLEEQLPYRVTGELLLFQL